MSFLSGEIEDVISDIEKYEFAANQEILDDCIEEELDAIEVENEGFESKCGNIFISNCGVYSFVCEFCDARLENLTLFGDHLKAKHLDNDFAETSNPGILTNLEIELDGVCENYVYDEDEQVTQNDEDTEVSNDTAPVRDGPVESSEPEVSPVDDSNLFCDLCKRKFATKSSFSRHKNRHKYKHITTRSKNIGTNIQSTELASGSEDVCDSLTNGLLFCDLCSREFTNLKVLRIHAVKRHGDQIPQLLMDDPTFLKCKYCHEPFEKVLERVKHEKTHSEDKPFRCQLCPKSFRVNFQRELHMNSHTGDHPFPCPHCPKAFKSAINRLQHIRGHLGIKRFSCEFCNKKFVTNVQRSIHVRIHTQEKPYQCEECGERFRVSGQLFSHSKRHKNNRNCICDVCGKRFFSNVAVKEHMVRHSNDHPFKCEECGREFKRRKNLITHQQLHSAKKTYACTICDKKFAQCAGLHSHMKSHGSKFNIA